MTGPSCWAYMNGAAMAKDRLFRAPATANPGNGALFFIRVDDFDESLERARELVSRFETYPEVFESGPGTNAFTIRDPDGYYVTVNAMGTERH
jgi:predicted enzyme related to lactoylglutathione lyase